MEFLGFCILVLVIGIVLGFLFGAHIQYKKTEEHNKLIKEKDNLINLWCKRINKKKQVVGCAKVHIIADLNLLKYAIDEMLKKMDDIFKE